MKSFLVPWFSNLHILWNLPKAISLQSFNAVNCLGQVLQRDYRYTMMTSFYVILYFWDLKFLYLWNWLWAINLPSLVIWIKFYRGWYKTPKNYHDVTSKYLVFKIAHFVEINRSYQPANLHWPRLTGSNFTRGGGKHLPPPPRLKRSQKAQSS